MERADGYIGRGRGWYFSAVPELNELKWHWRNADQGESAEVHVCVQLLSAPTPRMMGLRQVCAFQIPESSCFGTPHIGVNRVPTADSTYAGGRRPPDPEQSITRTY